MQDFCFVSCLAPPSPWQFLIEIPHFYLWTTEATKGLHKVRTDPELKNKYTNQTSDPSLVFNICCCENM